MRYRFCVISLITILLTFVMCPIIKTQTFVYADSTTDEWTQVTTNDELAEAFRYYCKSRNLTIDGSIADGITSFTTSTFNNICNTLGIDITALQANLKKSTDSNGGLRFLFDASGISTYNRIFAEFLQNNDLSEGQSVDNLNLYDGYYYDNSTLFVYRANNRTGGYYVHSDDTTNYISQIGTPYQYSLGYLIGNSSTTEGTEITYSYGDFTTSPTIRLDKSENHIYAVSSPSALSNYGAKYISSKDGYIGFYALGFNTYNNKFALIKYSYNHDNLYCLYQVADLSLYTNDDNTPQVMNVYMTTNNQTINNNNYEGDTIINNEGDIIEDSGGGESGGGESGGDTNYDIDFPDFNFPNIPNIDFNLGDLSHKFPFSIPFDLVAFFTVLNADPVAPSIDRTIPLPDPIADWHFEADFSQFDNYAVIIRNVEYIGFVIGLIYLTVRFVKG